MLTYYNCNTCTLYTVQVTVQSGQCMFRILFHHTTLFFLSRKSFNKIDGQFGDQFKVDNFEFKKKIKLSKGHQLLN